LRGLAWRFVAGEDLDAGLTAARSLSSRGIAATLNRVGTHVGSEAEAILAADALVAAVHSIASTGLDCHLSLKLTQVGLDIDPTLCGRQVDRILAAARSVGTFVRIDMEEAAYVAATVGMFDAARRSFGPDAVGLAWQSYLKGGRPRLERLVADGARIRLVKGGYWESADVVLSDRREIDAAFRADIGFLLRHGDRPAIATHDPTAVAHTLDVAAGAGIEAGGYEFQMLYGVKVDLQDALVRQGQRVRSYVPYGADWYEYVLGCLRRVPSGALDRLARRRPR
jgi:proline dehydrogenase